MSDKPPLREVTEENAGEIEPYEPPRVVVRLGGVTRWDLPPDQVLEKAIGKLIACMVIGWDADGEEYFASSCADGGTALWLLERAKSKLLSFPETIEGDPRELKPPA